MASPVDATNAESIRSMSRGETLCARRSRRTSDERLTRGSSPHASAARAASVDSG